MAGNSYHSACVGHKKIECRLFGIINVEKCHKVH